MKNFKLYILGFFMLFVACFVAVLEADAAPKYWHDDPVYPFVGSTQFAHVYLNGRSIKALRVPEEGHQPFVMKEQLISVDKNDANAVFEKPQVELRFYPYNEHAQDRFYYDTDGSGYKEVYFERADEFDMLMWNVLITGLQFLKDHEC